MNENKYCGNCKYFRDGDAGEKGVCTNSFTGDDFPVWGNEIPCKRYIHKNNGWTEITTENVDEVYNLIESRFVEVLDSRAMVVKGANDWRCNLSTMAKIGGYYYYVLPELKLED